MKKINIVKVSLFTLILAFIAIGTIAVAKVMNKEKTVEVEIAEATAVLAEQWFVYNGPDQTRNEVSDPANYSPHDTGDNPEPTCNDGTQLCALKAPENPNGGPSLDENFINEVMTAIAQGGTPSSEDIKLKF